MTATRLVSGGRRQRGVAFIIVIWLMALLVVLLGAFALIARTEGMQARHLYDATVARYAAEAGINQATYFLSIPDPQLRWIPDGREYAFAFDDAEIQIRITDESGLIDLNAADMTALTELFEGIGVELDQAAALAAAIQDWRDADDLVSPNGAEDNEYAGEGVPWGPKNAPFDMVSELLQVLGMTPDIYRQMETAVTVYSGQSRPNLAFAPYEIILAIPGMTPELAQQIIADRHAWDPSSGMPPPVLPDGSPLMAQGGTGTYSIESRATLPNGAWTQVDATIRLGGGGVSGMAYTVLRWQDGDSL
ncbi:type II secretion system protein GspK [Xanthomonadaceae bacterium JHOS43]|nr:type II secretion system protein GspK [Xanthomonadaceae bacterium JHOS43]MCX7562635.1 type II secretion system protein GspK [Xanthomonadaceae bacterium XH05]